MMHDAQDFTEIGKYRILKRLGTGAYGCVYLGQHPLLNRQVAIKVFLGNIDTTRERERFLREARILDQLKHPHILPFYDVGIQERPLDRDIAYLLVEYAPNGSLRDRLDACAPHPLLLDEALSLLAQIGDGLYYAHQHRVVHRDLKPENILFNAKGEALLADFGIAIVLSSGTQLGESIGTPAYMAPEQIQGSASQKSDQYALACMAYEMMTGQLPFAGPDRDTFIYQQLQQPPLSPRHVKPDLPISVEQALLRALEKDRNARYPDIPAFLAALQNTFVTPPLFAVSEPFHKVRIPSRLASSLSVPPRALRRQQEEDLFEEQPVVRRKRSVSQVSFSRSRNLPPRRQGVRALSHSAVRLQQKTPQPHHDWRIIRLCSFGLGGIVGGSVLLASLQNFPYFPFPFRVLLVIAVILFGIALLVGIFHAIAGSYQARDWKWFTLLIVVPVVAGLLGLIVEGWNGLSRGFVLGMLITIVLSILYGWRYAP